MATAQERHAEALFVSALQPSEHPAGEQVRAAVTAMVARLGADGVAELLAQEFGEHPESAARRMQWAITVVATAFTPAHA
jgi:hypothetical protein